MGKKDQPEFFRALLYFLLIFGGVAVIHLFLKGASEALSGRPLKGFEFAIIAVVIIAVINSNGKKKS